MNASDTIPNVLPSATSKIAAVGLAIWTHASNWQMKCLSAAENNLPFEIRGINQDQHLEFCIELCVTYGFKSVQEKTIARFIPTKNSPPRQPC